MGLGGPLSLMRAVLAAGDARGETEFSESFVAAFAEGTGFASFEARNGDEAAVLEADLVIADNFLSFIVKAETVAWRQAVGVDGLVSSGSADDRQ